MRRTFDGVALTTAALLVLSGCDDPEADTRGWTIVRQLANDDQLTTTVVQIAHEFVKQRSVYDAAVKTICSTRAHGNICIIGFFLPGDNTPTAGRLVKWGDYKPLAVWWGNDATGSKEFTGWDCVRAGVEGSPPSALCGIGVKEAYDVALDLGLRQGIGEFCHWPVRGDISTTLSAVLSDMAKYGRSEQMKSAYSKTLETGRDIGRTEKGYDCNAYHAKVDTMVDAAVSMWRAAVRGREQATSSTTAGEPPPNPSSTIPETLVSPSLPSAFSLPPPSALPPLPPAATAQASPPVTTPAAHPETRLAAVDDPWCKTARLPSSIAICSDPELWALAAERNRVFSAVRGQLTPSAQSSLLADQKNWVSTYSRKCGIEANVVPALPLAPQIKDCMLTAGRERIEYLRNYRGIKPTDDATAQSPNLAPAAGDCFMGGWCFEQYIVERHVDSSGVMTVRTRIESHCDGGDRCGGSPTGTQTAMYQIRCEIPGAYIDDGARRLPEPEPEPPHATRAAKQLWSAACSATMAAAASSTMKSTERRLNTRP
jgi:hypothetical protein